MNSKFKFIIVLLVYFIFIKFSYAITDDQYNQISALIEKQNIEKSFELLKIVQSGEKKLSPKTLLLFGKMYLELGNPSKAIEYFKSVINESSKLNSYAYAGIARSEFMLGNLSNSRKYAEKSQEIDPNLIDGKVILAQVLSEQNLNTSSEKLFLSSIEASDESTYALRKFVETLLRKNEIEEAEKILKENINENLIDAPILELFSDVSWLQGNFDKSISFRTDAEKKYRVSGNSIKANKVLAWLNFKTAKKLKKIEKKETSPKLADNIESNESVKVEPNIKVLQNEEIKKFPNRKAFEPRNKPQEIYIDTEKKVFTGTGVILNSGNWILTNRHIVEDLNYIVVRNGLGEIRNVEEIKVSEIDDLAVLILSENFPSDYSLSIADFDKGKTGSSIYVLGYPMASLFGSFHPSITEGIISNPLGFGENYSEFQITAKVNPGNSGGPIFNKFGKIVGITTGKIDVEKIYKDEGFYPEDINFGIKPERVISFLNKPMNESYENDFIYSAQELYKYMRSAIVFIIGQK